MPDPQDSWPRRSRCRRWLPWAGSPAACLHPGSLWGCQRVLQGGLGPSRADLGSLQRAKVSASSDEGLGNPLRNGLGWVSLRHPTETAAALGAAARWGAGGFSGVPRASGAPCSGSSNSVSLLQAFYLLGSNSAPGAEQGEGRAVPVLPAGRAFGVISRRAVSLAALLGAGWRGFRAS